MSPLRIRIGQGVEAERAAALRFIERRRDTAPIGTEAKSELEAVADAIRAGAHLQEAASG